MDSENTVSRRLCLGGLVATFVLLAASVGTASARTLYVSPKGKVTAPCSHAKPCRTISRALAKAHRGDQVLVARGTYHEQVTIRRTVKLFGSGRPTIDANGRGNGVLITGHGSAGSVVSGFLVRRATFEGIVAVNTTNVTITANTVTGNDRGVSATPLVGECAPQGAVPGDCGEGLHLMAVTYSRVRNNTVTNNAGGILLTDETGPTAFNKVTGNTVLDNVLDCGITLAGHNPKAVILSAAPGPPTMAGLAPSVGGVYSNLIKENTTNGNGTKGQGGGILLAGGPPGIAVYNNTVEGNTAEGNGLAGVTLHSHAPGQDLNGNLIMRNTLSNDGVNGYPNGTPGDSDAGITHPVGITIFSAASPLTGISVVGNQISNEYYGVWTKHAPVIPKSANTFASTVKVPLLQS